MGSKLVRGTFRSHLFECLAEGQRLCLCEHVCDEYVVMTADGLQRLRECDEVARDHVCPLMYQLVERVLAIRSGLAEVDGARCTIDPASVERHLLTVAFHRQLLEVGRKALQVLLIWQDREGVCSEKIRIPDRQKAEDNRQVAIEGRRPEVLV